MFTQAGIDESDRPGERASRRESALVELNEAFACQVLAVLKGWGWNDADKLNVNGSGNSLGHPIAATRGRILASMLNEMKRRAATRATASRPCASAAARASRRFSSGPDLQPD